MMLKEVSKILYFPYNVKNGGKCIYILYRENVKPTLRPPLKSMSQVCFTSVLNLRVPGFEFR